MEGSHLLYTIQINIEGFYTSQRQQRLLAHPPSDFWRFQHGELTNEEAVVSLLLDFNFSAVEIENMMTWARPVYAILFDTSDVTHGNTTTFRIHFYYVGLGISQNELSDLVQTTRSLAGSYPVVSGSPLLSYLQFIVVATNQDDSSAGFALTRREEFTKLESYNETSLTIWVEFPELPSPNWLRTALVSLFWENATFISPVIEQFQSQIHAQIKIEIQKDVDIMKQIEQLVKHHIMYYKSPNRSWRLAD